MKQKCLGLCVIIITFCWTFDLSTWYKHRILTPLTNWVKHVTTSEALLITGYNLFYNTIITHQVFCAVISWWYLTILNACFGMKYEWNSKTQYIIRYKPLLCMGNESPLEEWSLMYILPVMYHSLIIYVLGLGQLFLQFYRVSESVSIH